MTGREQRHDSWAGMATGWTVTGTMIGGIAAWGGIGYLVDRLLETEFVFTTIGFIVGALGGMYIVWLRHGRGEGGGS
jgi:F0F1-type ATP synthase assembly protein I